MILGGIGIPMALKLCNNSDSLNSLVRCISPKWVSVNPVI
jgi:hypothetical protein